ncbi:MAG: FtsW/RodA/SpoVE family cell cycle protein [Tepidanaerobacteraceae bacterium]
MDLSHNKKVQDYINEVCSQIRFRDVHQEIKLELEAHIHELVEGYLAHGLSKEEAIHKAIAQMGDAHIVGTQLNKVHKPKPEWSVLLFSFLFINMGLLSMYSIQKQSLLTYDIQIFEKSLLFSLIGFIFTVCLYFFDYRKLERYSIHIYVGTLLILGITILWGSQLNGSRCWLNLGPFNINFVAISPLLFIIAFAGIFNKWVWNNTLNLLKGLSLFVVPLIFILTAPSASTGIIYAVSCIVLMTVSGAKLREIVLISGPLIATIILPIIIQPYKLNRLLAFLSPTGDPLGKGYLNIQLRKILSASGLWGQGLTFDPKILPELHTDFIFAFITYTFGWIASILLIAFVVILLIRIASIAKQVKNSYAKLLISGFLSILSLQFLWNIFMNLGLAPISAVGLPFISYGGSQLIINAATIGIISSIYRRKNILTAYH